MEMENIFVFSNIHYTGERFDLIINRHTAIHLGIRDNLQV